MTQRFELHPVDPQARLLRQAAQILRGGGVAAVPTDACYVLACHLGDKQAVDRLRAIRGLDEKHLLKRSMRDLLPAAVLERTKQPYRAPDSQSFFSAGRAAPYVDELLSPRSLEAAGLFDAKRVGLLVEKCRAGRALGFADNMAFVSILSTMLVHEQLVLGREVPVEAATAPRPRLAVHR